MDIFFKPFLKRINIYMGDNVDLLNLLSRGVKKVVFTVTIDVI